MSRGEKNRNHSQKEVKFQIPTFLTQSQIDQILDGTDDALQPISEEKKPYLEALAKAFGLTPKWLKDN